MHRTTRLKMTDINPHVICQLCGGYLIDATTIIECLHSFCRTCILRYLESSKFCPICDVQVHKTKPCVNIRSDKTLQDLIYKLVPGLFKTEMKRRRDFYTLHPEAAPSTSSTNAKEERGEVDDERFIYTEKEHISLCLEHFDVNRKLYGKCLEIILNFYEGGCWRLRQYTRSQKKKEKKRKESSPDQRFLLCPAGVTISHLKKFIRLKFNLQSHFKIDIFHTEENLEDAYTLMDVACIYSWRRVEPLKLYYVVYDIKNKRRKVEKLECPAERPLSTDPITNTEAVQEATDASASVGKSSTDPDVLTSTAPALATSEKPDVTIIAGPDAINEPETATGASESEMLDVEVMNAGATPREEKSSSDVVIPGSKSDSPIIIEDSEMSSPEKKDTDVPAVAIAVTTPSDIDAQAVLLPLPTPSNKEGETNVLPASESEIPIHDNKAPSGEQSVNVAGENRAGTPPAEDQLSLEHCVDRSEKENVPTDVEPVCVSIQNKSDCLTKVSTENDALVLDETARKHPSVNSKVVECTKDVSSETPSTPMQDTIIKQDVIAKENVSNMKETVLVAKDETAQISKDSVFSGKPYGKPKTNTKEAKKTMSSLIAELVKNKTKMAPVPIRPKELCSSVVSSHLTTTSQSGCVQTQANMNGTPALCKDSQAQQTLKKRNGSSSNFVALSRNAVRKNDISCQQSFANQTIPSAITSIPQINTVVTSSPPISTAVTSSLLSTFQSLQKSLPIGASNNNATSVLKKSCSVQNRTIVAQRGVNSGSNIHHQKRKSSPVKNSLKGDQIGIPVSMAYLNLPLSVRNGKETYIQISQIGSSKVTTISTEATSSSSNAPHSTCSSPQSPDQTPSPAQTPPTLTSSQSPSGGQISPARMTQLIVPNPLSPTQSVTSKSRKEQTSVSRRVSPGGATFPTTAAQLAGLGPQITMTPVSSAVTQTNTSAREVVAKGDMTMAQLLSAATVSTVPRRNQNSVMRAQLSTPKSHLAQPSNKRSPSNQSEKRTKQRDLRNQGFGNALINDIQQQANQMFTRFPTCYQAPPTSIKIQKAHQAQLHSKYPGAILSVPTYSGREYNVRYNYMSPKPTHTVPQVSSDDMPQDLSIKKNKKDDNFNNRNSTMDHMEVAGDN